MRTKVVYLAIAMMAFANAGRLSADETDERAAAQAIAANMKQSGLMKDYRVGVKFQDGVAWLMGTVTSEEQKQTAEQIARETEGVDNVVNKLEVVGTQPSTKTNAGRTNAENIERVSMQAPQPLRRQAPKGNMPVPYARTMQGQVQPAGYGQYAGPGMGPGMGPMPTSSVPPAVGQAVSYDNPQLPGYAWPSYAASPNYAALTYPQQYSPSAWPYIGPFYPYPQVPLGWRKVTLEWDDGWWMLDFKDCKDCY